MGRRRHQELAVYIFGYHLLNQTSAHFEFQSHNCNISLILGLFVLVFLQELLRGRNRKG